MNYVAVIVSALLFAGCSTEVATGAATAAAGRAQEAKQAQQTIGQIQQRLDAAAQVNQNKLETTERANP